MRTYIQCDFVAGRHEIFVGTSIRFLHVFAVSLGEVLLWQLVDQLFVPEPFALGADLGDLLRWDHVEVSLDLWGEWKCSVMKCNIRQPNTKLNRPRMDATDFSKSLICILLEFRISSLKKIKLRSF